jgi:hypothetical protein
MRTIVLFIWIGVFSLFGGAALSQIPSHIAESYQGFVAAEKQVVFYDDFSQNQKNHIVTDLSNVSVYFSNGSYVIKNKTNGYWLKFLVSPADANFPGAKYSFSPFSDFEIEARIKLAYGPMDKDLSLVWGANYVGGAITSYQALATSRNGYYTLYNYVGNQYQEVKKWTKLTSIVDGYNIYTVRKVGNTVYSFVNGILVYSENARSWQGLNIGVNLPPLSEAHVDYLNVSYLRFDTQAPKITLSQSRGMKPNTQKIEGQVSDEMTGVFELTANGSPVPFDNQGRFSIEASGNVLIAATDFKGNRSEKQVLASVEPIENQSNPPVSFGKKVALVIGNSSYGQGAASLKNPVNDARSMSQALQNMGFEVISGLDLGYLQMMEKIKLFAGKCSNSDVALFYFAGHGMQTDGENYLLPVDIKLNNGKSDLAFEAVKVEMLTEVMGHGDKDRLNILILDACRNNPFRSWDRGGSDGLAEIKVPSGTLVAFATSPGSTASDGSGENGLYTGELIKQIQKPQRIEDVFINTRIEVERKSGNQQSPWELARLRGIYYLMR